MNLNDYQLVLRQDFCAFLERSFYQLHPGSEFLHNWHLEVIAAELEACRRGETQRLIVNVPPRSLKSESASVAFPAWLLGHNPSAQIICASYGQELAQKLAFDCRSLLSTRWYQDLFPTRLERSALQDIITAQHGCRLATSVGGPLTGRGADYIIIDDPLKPEEAISQTRRKAVNDWFDHTLYSRLNDKAKGCIILIMQRLHEDDLVGHVLSQENWRVLRFPAVAEHEETFVVHTPYGERRFSRRTGEVLHAAREPHEVLLRIRETTGEYNFAGQYQQAPTPLGGGMIQQEWFKRYVADQQQNWNQVFQSWDTANKPSELSDYTVCTTWGVRDKNLYLRNVYRKRLGYPDLKRAVREQAELFDATTVLIEDRASGTQLIQDLIQDGLHAVQAYQSTLGKVMRMYSVTSTIENGFVYLPEQAPWRDEYVHELTTFPKGKYDDQADSTSQALDWFKSASRTPPMHPLIEIWRQDAEKDKAGGSAPANFSVSRSDTLRRLEVLRRFRAGIPRD